MAENDLLAVIEQRMRDLIAEIHDGGNASPGSRFRLEGLLEAAVITGLGTEQHFWHRYLVLYRELTGEEGEALFGERWAQAGEFPALPVGGRRAPVYPTTKEL